MRILKRVLLILLVLLLLTVAGFTAWAYTPLGPMPEATAALQSDSVVQVVNTPWLTFTPVGTQPTTGFVFYPGGRVDARSYAPAARAIAAQGYLVVITPVPFNLAVFKPAAADAVIAAHPEIARWAVGGHSLGGAMAANYVYTHPNAVQGLVLWAAYPAGNNSLADHRLAVGSIYGTRDGLASRFEMDAYRALLPPPPVTYPSKVATTRRWAGTVRRAAMAKRPSRAPINKRKSSKRPANYWLR